MSEGDSVMQHSGARGFFLWLSTITGIIVLSIVGIGVWYVRAYLPVIGYVWLAAIGLVPVIALCYGIAFLLRVILHTRIEEIGPNGTLVQRLWGVKTVAPMAIAEPVKRIEKEKPNRIQVPTIGALLKDGILDGVSLLLGYQLDGTARWGTWEDVRTFAIGGKSRAGKTVTMLFYILQALLSGAVVWVCDPHATKNSGITKLLEPLLERTDVIRVAGTDEEIMALTTEYVTEMEDRVHGVSTEGLRPRLLVIDEWTRLVSRRSKEERDTLVHAVCACAEEYAGYGGYAIIGGHEWTARESGGSNLRRSLHAVFVHRLDADYAKFLLQGSKGQKIAKQAPNLATGTAYFQDSEGQLDTLVIPYGNRNDVLQFVTSFLPMLPEPVTLASIPERINRLHEQALTEDDLFDMEEIQMLPKTTHGNAVWKQETGTETGTETHGNGPVERREPISEVIALPSSMNRKQEDRDTEGDIAVSLVSAPSVSVEEWKREAILAMHKQGYKAREIAKLVGMSGGSYKKFQAVCTELNISFAVEAKEGK